MFSFSTIREVIESIIFDSGRIWRDREKVKRYRDHMFRRIFSYSKNVPLYRKKYENMPDVRTIQEIRILPMVSKEEIKKGYPDDIIDNKNRRDLVIMSSSGSTGKPTKIYRDTASILRSYILTLRVLKAHGLNFFRERIMNIGDFAVENSYDRMSINILDKIGVMKFLKNVVFIPFDKDTDEIIEIFRKFKPSVISGYPIIMAELARAMVKKGIEIRNTKLVASSGYVLDRYTRNLLEDLYGAKVVDVYGSIEIDTAAFQCREGLYHINSDLIHIEVLDDGGNPVSPGESGMAIATRLYGRDTPIIRYSGLEDMVKTSEERCSCGINTDVLERIEGRSVDALVLPDGRFISPFVATTLIMNSTRDIYPYVMRQFQIVQKREDLISINVVLDEDVKDHETICNKIRDAFSRELGMDAEVKVVDRVENYGRVLPPPVVSEVWKSIKQKEKSADY